MLLPTPIWNPPFVSNSNAVTSYKNRKYSKRTISGKSTRIDMVSFLNMCTIFPPNPSPETIIRNKIVITYVGRSTT